MLQDLYNTGYQMKQGKGSLSHSRIPDLFQIAILRTERQSRVHRCNWKLLSLDISL